MAQSPSHKFGQLIGHYMETLVAVPLEAFAKQFGVYLDYKNKVRSARGKKISWVDDKGNSHDLDFVFEMGGSDEAIGKPVAFIECAWRRYTKHSRNKAQEIQGALLPLAESYQHNAPFLGVILAGEFTEKSLAQLMSHGFFILYFPYNRLVKAFQLLKVNIAYEESESDDVLLKRLPVLEQKLSHLQKSNNTHILDYFQNEVDVFFKKLQDRFERKLTRIIILPIFGTEVSFFSATDAILFLNEDNEISNAPLIRHEIQLFFSNRDEIKAVFLLKSDAIAFLQQYVK
ncbi:MAG: hypothetical protein FWD31_08340 [Planctomycetaceae bacterium]|nr:hypothetical protein [Planctomycetaceae bacterium]